MDATLAGREFRAPSGTRSAGRRPAADDGVLARLQLLHAIDDALLSAESVGAVAAAAVRLLRDIAGVDRAALWAWVPEAAEGRLLAAAPPADPPMAGRAAPIQDVPATLIERLVRGELVQLDRAVDGEVMTALPTLPAWARTWCAIPLVDGDGALGAITLVQRRGSPIDPVTIAVLRSAGAHVATALRRVQLREQLRIASERTAAILESSPIGILIAGCDGRILHANAAAESMVGATESLAGTAIDPILPGLDTDGLSSRGPASDGGRQVMALHRLGGDPLPVAVSASPLPHTAGDGVIVTMIDRAEHQALERRLLDAQRLEMAGQFTSMAAHDFRNYLTAIGGFADLLADDLAGEREELREIMTAVARGQESVAAMLAFARPADPADRTSGTTGHLNRILPLLAHLARPAASVELVAQPDLPDVRIGPGALTQVLMNLVTNARDAMPGGGAIEIRARCESPTGWARRATDGVVIEVSDSGEGMDDATLRRVFEPFFSTKPPGDGVGEGTGLGLPSVKFHLTRVGGTVGVVSRPGVGTTVELRIPVAVTA